jgi:hypothetical protein
MKQHQNRRDTIFVEEIYQLPQISPTCTILSETESTLPLKDRGRERFSLLIVIDLQSTVFLLPPPPRHYHHKAHSSPRVTTIVQSKIAAIGIDKVATISSRAAAA